MAERCVNARLCLSTGCVVVEWAAGNEGGLCGCCKRVLVTSTDSRGMSVACGTLPAMGKKNRGDRRMVLCCDRWEWGFCERTVGCAKDEGWRAVLLGICGCWRLSRIRRSASTWPWHGSSWMCLAHEICQCLSVLCGRDAMWSMDQVRAGNQVRWMGRPHADNTAASDVTLPKGVLEKWAYGAAIGRVDVK